MAAALDSVMKVRERKRERVWSSALGSFFFLYMCVGEGLDGHGCRESVDIVGMCEWFVMGQELAGHEATTLLPHQAKKR